MLSQAESFYNVDKQNHIRSCKRIGKKMRAPILRKLNLVSDRKYTPFLKLNDQSMMSKYQDT